MASTTTINLDDAPGDSEPIDTESPDLDKVIEVGENPVEGVQDGVGPQVSGDITPALAHQTKDQPHVIFIDPVGTRWTFPYESAKTWNVSHRRYLYYVHH